MHSVNNNTLEQGRLSPFALRRRIERKWLGCNLRALNRTLLHCFGFLICSLSPIIPQVQAQNGGTVVGVDICDCAPSVIEIRLNLSSTCQDTSADFVGPGASPPSCSITFQNETTQAQIPAVVVRVIDIYEVDQNLEAISYPPSVFGDFFTGDSINYTSVVDPTTVNATSLPLGLQINMLGLTANNETLKFATLIAFTNDCTTYPAIRDGSQIGWASFYEAEKPFAALCPLSAASSILPTSSPSITRSPSITSPASSQPATATSQPPTLSALPTPSMSSIRPTLTTNSPSTAQGVSDVPSEMPFTSTSAAPVISSGPHVASSDAPSSGPTAIQDGTSIPTNKPTGGTTTSNPSASNVPTPGTTSATTTSAPIFGSAMPSTFATSAYPTPGSTGQPAQGLTINPSSGPVVVIPGTLTPSSSARSPSQPPTGISGGGASLSPSGRGVGTNPPTSSEGYTPTQSPSATGMGGGTTSPSTATTPVCQSGKGKLSMMMKGMMGGKGGGMGTKTKGKSGVSANIFEERLASGNDNNVADCPESKGKGLGKMMDKKDDKNEKKGLGKGMDKKDDKKEKKKDKSNGPPVDSGSPYTNSGDKDGLAIIAPSRTPTNPPMNDLAAPNKTSYPPGFDPLANLSASIRMDPPHRVSGTAKATVPNVTQSTDITQSGGAATVESTSSKHTMVVSLMAGSLVLLLMGLGAIGYTGYHLYRESSRNKTESMPMMNNTNRSRPMGGDIVIKTTTRLDAGSETSSHTMEGESSSVSIADGAATDSEMGGEERSGTVANNEAVHGGEGVATEDVPLVACEESRQREKHEPSHSRRPSASSRSVIV